VEERKAVELLYNSSRTRAKRNELQTKCEFNKELKQSAVIMVQLLLSGNMYKVLINENLILNLLPRKYSRPKIFTAY